jgi:HEAT repeat protein
LGVLIGTPTDGKTELTQEFIKSTGERGAEGLVDALETGKFRAPKDREVVVRALGYEQYLTAAKPFTTLLDNKDTHLRNCVVVTLEEMGDAVAAKPLLARYAKERSPEVRKDILRALGPTGKDNEEARALLLDSVKGGPEILRTAAAVALGDHVSGSKDVRDALAKAYARAGRGNLKLGVLYAYWIGNDPECAAELGRIKETERNNELVQLAEVIQAGLQDRDPDVGSGGGRGGRGGRGGDFGGNFGAFRALGALRQLFADDKIARHPNGRLRRLLGGFGGGR